MQVSIEGDATAAAALATAPSLEEAPTPKGGASGREKDAECRARHPLAVKVETPCKGGTLTMRFLLLVKLNVITVEAAWQGGDGPGLLGRLFPGDDGSHSPNAANALWLASQSTEWDASLPGKPFRWAQWLGGLTFLRSEPGVGSNCGSTIPKEPFSTVMRLVQERAS